MIFGFSSVSSWENVISSSTCFYLFGLSLISAVGIIPKDGAGVNAGEHRQGAPTWCHALFCAILRKWFRKNRGNADGFLWVAVLQ